MERGWQRDAREGRKTPLNKGTDARNEGRKVQHDARGGSRPRPSLAKAGVPRHTTLSTSLHPPSPTLVDAALAAALAATAATAIRTHTCPPSAGRYAPPPCPLLPTRTPPSPALPAPLPAAPWILQRDAAAAVLLGVAVSPPAAVVACLDVSPCHPPLCPRSCLSAAPPAARASLCCASLRADGQAARVPGRCRGSPDAARRPGTPLAQDTDLDAMRATAAPGGRSFCLSSDGACCPARRLPGHQLGCGLRVRVGGTGWGGQGLDMPVNSLGNVKARARFARPTWYAKSCAIA
mmetsp:Transcript_20429/g.64034  ORF Transcript_20429/g.64034 Transcript_20429/m.64034 type:complete len:293 (-) Transcript_20429:577-1455(-)